MGEVKKNIYGKTNFCRDFKKFFYEVFYESYFDRRRER